MSHYSDITNALKHHGVFRELEFIERLISHKNHVRYHDIIYTRYFKPEDPPTIAKLHRDELTGISYRSALQIKNKIERMMRHPYWYKAKEE